MTLELKLLPTQPPMQCELKSLCLPFAYFISSSWKPGCVAFPLDSSLLMPNQPVFDYKTLSSLINCILIITVLFSRISILFALKMHFHSHFCWLLQDIKFWMYYFISNVCFVQTPVHFFPSSSFHSIALPTRFSSNYLSFFLNPLSPPSTANIYMDIGSSTGPWEASQGSHLWGKLTRFSPGSCQSPIALQQGVGICEPLKTCILIF